MMLGWLLDRADESIWWWLFVYICLPWAIFTAVGAWIYFTIRRRKGL